MGQDVSKCMPKIRRSNSTRVDSMGGQLQMLIKNNSVLPSDYKVKSPPLGRGPFGEIREAYHVKMKQKFLMKIIFKTQFSEKELRDIQSEYQLIKELAHPNIIGVREFFQEDRFIYIIMDHFKGRDLFDKVKVSNGIRDEFIAGKILFQLAQTLRFIHSNNVAYLNLKLESILYNGRQIALHDFSSAVKLKSGQKLKDFVGSLSYVAPEVIKGEYDCRADVWSFGVIMYVMLYGRYPFTGNDEETIMNNILKLEPETRTLKPPSVEAIELICMLLRKQPEARPTWQQIEEHGFFKKNRGKETLGLQIMFEKVRPYLLSFRISSLFELGLYLYFLRSYMSNIDGSNIVKEIFMAIDSKANGKIGVKELKNFCKEYELTLSDVEINAIVKNLDTDGSGTIEYEEFLAGCCDRSRLLTDGNLTNFFRQLTGNEKDFLTVKDFKEIFVSTKIEDIQNFFEEWGVSQKGELRVPEFVTIMKKLI